MGESINPDSADLIEGWSVSTLPAMGDRCWWENQWIYLTIIILLLSVVAMFIPRAI